MPTRTCVVCRTQGAPSTLLRIAAGADGALLVGRLHGGRGAWVCSPECFHSGVEKGRIGRALRTGVDRESVAAAAENVEAYFHVP